MQGALTADRANIAFSVTESLLLIAFSACFVSLAAGSLAIVLHFEFACLSAFGVTLDDCAGDILKDVSVAQQLALLLEESAVDEVVVRCK